MSNKRWNVRPDNATWGDWGPDDQLGRLNLITPEKVRKAVEEVQTGITFCLSLPLDYPQAGALNQVRFPPVLKPVVRNSEDYYNYRWDKLHPNHTDIASDDYVLLYTQYSTQWDSLAHRGAMFDVMGDGVERPVYYNGFAPEEDVVLSDDGKCYATSLGIENMAVHGLQGRGVLLDLYSQFGAFPRKVVGYDDLMNILEKNNMVVEEGDILCLWTGLDRLILEDSSDGKIDLKRACATLDGTDQRLLQWIVDSKISAIASDNLAVEEIGNSASLSSKGSNLPLHKICLFELGVPLGELWQLFELAEWLKANNRYRFLLTAPPLRLPGAVGSPVTPVATV